MQRVYAQALAVLQRIDPTIYRYLSAAPLGGGSRPIRTVPAVDNSTTPPTTIEFIFHLEVSPVALGSGKQADFRYDPPSLTPTGTTRKLDAPMHIDVSPIYDPAAVTGLATSLYHEGIHMLLYMEQILSASPPSPHAAAFANYGRVAQQHTDYGPLLAELEVFIDLDLGKRNAGQPRDYARNGARETINHVIEEKYVFDQEKAQFGTQFTNRSLALSYVLDSLTELGVRASPTDRNVVTIVDKATRILDDIDRLIRVQPVAPTTPGPGAPAPGSAPTSAPAPRL
jgi:hypothetical protein